MKQRVKLLLNGINHRPNQPAQAMVLVAYKQHTSTVLVGWGACMKTNVRRYTTTAQHDDSIGLGLGLGSGLGKERRTLRTLHLRLGCPLHDVGLSELMLCMICMV